MAGDAVVLGKSVSSKSMLGCKRAQREVSGKMGGRH